MKWNSANYKKGDPSDIKQQFTPINIKLHCCRYWKLTEWDFKNMSYPFWRLYYNTVKGANIIFNNKKIELNEEIVVLIPPYTSFSTSLKNVSKESFNGDRIQSPDECNNLEQLGMVDHLFIHFNMGFQYDLVKPDIYDFAVSSSVKTILDQIRLSTILNFNNFDFNQTLKINFLIVQLINEIPISKRKSRNFDSRVIKIIDYIEHNFTENIRNDILGEIVAMAPNSILRLFKSSTGYTLQDFVQNKRIEKSIILMHNQSASIDQIAEECGFSDRHHFSKVFKRKVNIPPALYRKMHTLS